MAAQILSTYARIYIGLSPTLVDVIKKHSRQRPSAEASTLPITILSEHQINQALSHPQSATLKEFIKTAYSDIIKTDNIISDARRSLYNQRISIEETLFTLQEVKVNKNTSPAIKARLEGIMDTLNKQLLVMNSLKTSIDNSQRESTTLNNDSANLIQKHESEWDDFRGRQLKALHKAIDNVLRDAGYHTLDPVPGGEVDNLLRQDQQEALDRYTDLAANDLPAKEMEKILGLKNPDFDTYFKIKAYLALRSVNPPLETRAKLMGQLNQFFNEAKLEAKALFDKQQGEIKSIDERNIKPVLNSTASCQTQLKNLDKDRGALLAAITTRALEEEIREKVQQRISAEAPKPGFGSQT